MMLAHLAGHHLTLELRTHLERGTMNSGDVLIAWNAAAEPGNPNVESSYAPPILRTAVLAALIHIVSVKASASTWTMFQEGDAIVTFDAEHLDLSDKREVTFTLPDGHLYTQQVTDRDPVEFWSTFVGGRTLTKTLHLRRKGDRIRIGQVYYFDAAGRRTPIYTYDRDTRRFQRIADAPALIDDSDAAAVRIAIGGQDALIATADRTVAGEFIAVGGSELADLPRLEFWVGAVRCASLSVHRLAVADLRESVRPDGDERQIAFGMRDWIFSLGDKRAVAPSYRERLWGIFPTA
jgi:hypothetical protein